MAQPLATFHADQAGPEPLEEFQNLVPPQLSPQDDRTSGIDAVDLENGLGQIDADRGNLRHGWLPLVVTFDSTQCGTLRCREREPSTPSMAHQ